METNQAYRRTPIVQGSFPKLQQIQHWTVTIVKETMTLVLLLVAQVGLVLAVSGWI